MIFLSCDAAPGFLGILVSEAGHERGHPKKGRGTSNGFGRNLVGRTSVRKFGFKDLGRKTWI
jgi:hypothetical protein